MVCVHYASVYIQKGKGNERRGERSGSVCHKMSKNAAALEKLFFVCLRQVENLLDFLGSEQKLPKNDLFNE